MGPDSRDVVKSGIFGRHALQRRNVESAWTAELKRRGFELVLEGEKKFQGAGLVLVGSRDVEVEDGRNRAGYCAVECGAVSLVGVDAVDGDDQMGKL